MIHNTFVVNPVRPDYIKRCLDTLYRFTSGNFKVIVVDQTADGVYQLVKDAAHLYLRPHRNLGFAKSQNEGIIHGMRWDSKYITCMNDDVEFINHKWWDGILETFDIDEKIMAVNPMSTREPGWGYGLDHGTYIDLLPYKEEYTEEEYQWLLAGDFAEKKKEFNHLFEEKGRNNTFPDKKVGVIDAIATWCTTFKKEAFEKFGLFEERYYPGGGEDYSYNAGVYSCWWGSDGVKRRDFCDGDGHEYNGSGRMVGTTRSWAWHWWGSSKDKQGEFTGKGLPIIPELCWNNPHLIWNPADNNGQNYDPWGHYTDSEGKKHAMIRDKETGIIEI